MRPASRGQRQEAAQEKENADRCSRWRVPSQSPGSASRARLARQMAAARSRLPCCSRPHGCGAGFSRSPAPQPVSPCPRGGGGGSATRPPRDSGSASPPGPARAPCAAPQAPARPRGGIAARQPRGRERARCGGSRAAPGPGPCPASSVGSCPRSAPPHRPEPRGRGPQASPLARSRSEPGPDTKESHGELPV